MGTDAPDARFTVADLVAVILGAAVAMTLMRSVGGVGGSAAGLVLGGLAGFLTAVTASGPFVVLARRWLRPGRDCPRIGEWLWAALGTPFVLTAIVQSARGPDAARDQVLGWVLGGGMAVVTVVASVGLARWVEAGPDEASEMAGGPWTNRVGFMLAVALPLQVGLVLLFLAPS